MHPDRVSRPRKEHREWPPYVYPRRKGLYMYEYNPVKKRIEKPVRLCDAGASTAEVWRAYEENQGCLALTLARLADKFEASPQWAKLAVSTQRDRLICKRQIFACKTSAGLMGDIEAKRVTRGLIRQYLDKRMLASESRARHEGRYLKRLFSWACERDLLAENPAKGVTLGTDTVRSRYVTDAELWAFLGLARSGGSPWLAPFAEIAYRARLRPAETLALSDASVMPEGLYCRRTKGSTSNTVAITDALAAAIEEIKTLRSEIWRRLGLASAIKPEDRRLFIGHSGRSITMSGLHTQWRRLMADWPPEKRFTPHDLKRKGISDTPAAERRKSAGHRSAQMAANYDTKPEIVLPAGAQK